MQEACRSLVHMHAFEYQFVDLGLRAEDDHLPEAFRLEAGQRAVELGELAGDGEGSDGALGAGLIARLAEGVGEVEDDGDGGNAGLAGEFEEWSAGARADVGSVHDREPVAPQAFGDDEVEEFEGVVGDGLVIGVIGDECPAVIRGYDLGRAKVAAGEGGFAGACRPDQEDEGSGG